MSQLVRIRPPRDRSNRRIIGLSLDPCMAGDLKRLAQKRGLTFKGLFLEMYEAYEDEGRRKMTSRKPAPAGCAKHPIVSRQIVGLSLDVDMARELKALAKQNGLTFKKLFLQMYAAYQRQETARNP